LVELIVLNIGFEAHIINERIFLIMVMMALVTTFVTTPVISVLYKPGQMGPPPTNMLSMDDTSATTTMRPKLSVTDVFPVVSRAHVHMLVLVDDMNLMVMLTKIIWLFKPHRGFEDDLQVTALKVRIFCLSITSFCIQSPNFNNRSLNPLTDFHHSYSPLKLTNT